MGNEGGCGSFIIAQGAGADQGEVQAVAGAIMIADSGAGCKEVGETSTRQTIGVFCGPSSGPQNTP